MSFFKHSEAWFKGESIEGGMLGVFGVGLIALAIYFWKIGNTSTYRALVIPFLAIGLLLAGACGIGLWRNSSRVEAFRAKHAKAPAAFVKSEKKRVEGFMKWYRPLLIGWSVLMFVGLGLFHFWGGNRGRAIGLMLIVVALAGLMVDHTSEQNARTYHAEIKKASGS
jgi:hypothetical protein